MPRRPLPTDRVRLHECCSCHARIWVDTRTWRQRGGMCAACGLLHAERRAARQVAVRGVAVRYAGD